MSSDLPVHLFDRELNVSIVERALPHWSQAGTITFITWRTADSMPTRVLDEWRLDRSRWLLEHGIDSKSANWREQLDRLDPKLTRQFLELFWNRWHDALDAGHGACVLRDPALRDIVADSLHHFDGDRYCLLDFVTMPNHVHLLAAFPDEDDMLAQCESWKHFTAAAINRRLMQKDRFWQKDAFDHLVRSEEQFQHLRRLSGEWRVVRFLLSRRAVARSPRR